MTIEYINEADFRRSFIDVSDEHCEVAQKIYELCGKEYNSDEFRHPRVGPAQEHRPLGPMISIDEKSLIFFIDLKTERNYMWWSNKQTYRVRIERMDDDTFLQKINKWKEYALTFLFTIVKRLPS